MLCASLPVGGSKCRRFDTIEGERLARKEPIAGFGQSFWEDLRYVFRFWIRRGRAITWRVPSDAEQRKLDAHPIIGRFGNQTRFVADVGTERWLVRDRDWWGWPDPPRYAYFVLDGDRLVVAADFNAWPVAWGPNPDKIGAVDVP
jgi:hypothetical protein